jgi:hypothetical protein
MTDAQLYLAIGIPSFVALVGILVNVGYFVALNGRLQALENRLDGRIDRLENRFHDLEVKFEILTGKVIEIDNRLN